MWFYAIRNEVLFAWHNVPTRALHMVAGEDQRADGLARSGARHPLLFARALLAGYAMCLSGRVKSKPVAVPAYGLYRLLQKRRAARFDELASRLPLN